jgi:hypothetical protein
MAARRVRTVECSCEGDVSGVNLGREGWGSGEVGEDGRGIAG